MCGGEDRLVYVLLGLKDKRTIAAVPYKLAKPGTLIEKTPKRWWNWRREYWKVIQVYDRGEQQ